MKTLISLVVPLLVGSLAMVEPVSAQVRESSVSVSTFTVYGPPGPRHAPPYYRGPALRHGPRHYHPARHGHAHSQARLASWYASTAVAQARQGWRYGCANNHPRWSTSYRDHYHWAAGANRKQVMREVDRRDAMLARCTPYRR
jgi:hypothetical protein